LGEPAILSQTLARNTSVAILQESTEENRLNDQIEFFGEYEWNDKGGVIHWTHDDPEEIHVNGWIFHNNVIYQ